MIEIKGITKSFKDKKVLHGISGKFVKGKTNLIIGASDDCRSSIEYLFIESSEIFL